MQEELKALRVDIDKNIQAVRKLRPTMSKGARELSLVHTKLQEAKMWVGKVMEENDSPLPAEFRDEYKEGK